MTPRRSGRARKNRKALGGVISAQLEELTYLARELNGEVAPGGDADLVASAAAVIDAAASAAYPDVSNDAAERFNALADGTPLHVVVGPHPPITEGRRHFITFGTTRVYLSTRSAAGVWVVKLARLFVNPQRDRLRHCPICRRWFVDETRNRSALRCSRKCTIAWSNAQRPKGSH